MKRIVLVLYGLAAMVAMLYPAVSEAGRTYNHNENLVRDTPSVPE